MDDYVIVREGRTVGSMGVSERGVCIVGGPGTDDMGRLAKCLGTIPGTIWKRNGSLVVDLLRPRSTPGAVLRLVRREVERGGFVLRGRSTRR
ncbi:hypothetical protein [Methanomassiliicoccus luminyensis]|uniref:hypothetical protein n=1 Tax=Methanomassiliicoccus luminyensis TaxID=1080712 RepID=UPI000368ED88|nr:hypothetical protein [Methanomassiliicoccus luminyensis]